VAGELSDEIDAVTSATYGTVGVTVGDGSGVITEAAVTWGTSPTAAV